MKDALAELESEVEIREQSGEEGLLISELKNTYNDADTNYDGVLDKAERSDFIGLIDKGFG